MAELDIAEILKEVKRIQIIANRQVNDFLSGGYHSVFKGQGMEFEEVRAYVPGDEIRSIDWNVTARSGEPHIKRFREERELTMLLVVDISASGMFGSKDKSKLEIATMVAAVLMLSALKNNDKVGLVLFANGVKAYYPPRKGKGQVMRLIRELLAVEPVREETDLVQPLEFLAHVQRRKATVFLLSDFIADGWIKALKATNQRHDCIGITLTDPREEELPNIGFINLEDAETGEVVTVDTRSPTVRKMFNEFATTRTQKLKTQFRQSGVDCLEVRTDRPYIESLLAFFRMRERRAR